MNFRQEISIYGLEDDRVQLLEKLYKLATEASSFEVKFRKAHIAFQCNGKNNRVNNCVCINPTRKKLKVSFQLEPKGVYDNIVDNLVKKHHLTPYINRSGQIEMGVASGGWYAFHVENDTSDEAMTELFKTAHLFNFEK